MNVIDICSEIDEVFRALPLPIDNMNAEVIRLRKCILEQYTQVRPSVKSRT